MLFKRTVTRDFFQLVLFGETNEKHSDNCNKLGRKEKTEIVTKQHVCATRIKKEFYKIGETVTAPYTM
jgi:hypothetical protein